MEYQERCERAATGQGLDPVVAELRGLGVGVSIDQTGGMTMLARVDGTGAMAGGFLWIGVNEEESRFTDDDDEIILYDVGIYADDDPESGAMGESGLGMLCEAETLVGMGMAVLAWTDGLK